MKTFRLFLLPMFGIPFIYAFFLFGAGEAVCGRPGDRLDEMIGPSDAAVLIDPRGRVVVRRHAERPLIPASTIKVLTSLAAFHYLGPDYRFETEFYMDGDHNLKIKGYGDPLLVSEVLPDIAIQIRGRCDRFNDLLVDASYFDKTIRIPGVSRSSQPYDAPIGPLSVNFNTISFHRKKERYIGDEPHAPLVPTALAQIRKSGLKRGRIPLSPDNTAPALYAGELFRHHFLKAGIASKGKIATGNANPMRDRLIYRFVSEYTLRDIVARLLAFSNNFMANQLFLSFGAAALGPPATLEKGVAAASAYAAEILKLHDFHLVEGSGISRENRIPPDELLKVLAAFEPHRMLMRRDGEEYYKTGTLAGIATRAGFIEDSTEGLYRFAVMMNTPGKPIRPVLEYLRRLAQ